MDSTATYQTSQWTRFIIPKMAHCKSSYYVVLCRYSRGRVKRVVFMVIDWIIAPWKRVHCWLHALVASLFDILVLAPYSTTLLHVGTMVNAPLCSSPSLFLYILCHTYIFSSFCRNFFFLVFALFMDIRWSDLIHCHNHRTAMQAYGPHVFILEWQLVPRLHTNSEMPTRNYFACSN